MLLGDNFVLQGFIEETYIFIFDIFLPMIHPQNIYKMKSILIFVCLAALGQSFNTANPSWIADSTFYSGSHVLFSSLTSAPFASNFTATFGSTFSDNPPAFTFGIKAYEGNDYLVQEYFNLSMHGVTNTQATIQLQLQGITAPLLLEISYILMRQQPGYNIHFMHGMDLNYSSTLTNITTMSPVLQNHTEIINFATSQVYFSWNAAYQQFTTPYSNNKILFFLTALHMVATSVDPLQFDLNYAIINNSHYSVTLSVGFNVTITRYSFNQIFYNSGDWNSSLSPYLNAYEWVIANSTLSTNTQAVDSVLVNNQFIIGLKTFNTDIGQATLDFNAVYGTFSGNYGVQVQPSIPSNSSLTGLTSSVASVFYMMTYTCTGGFPYLNITTLLCQDVCATFGYLNATDSTCRQCVDSLCYSCNASNPSICLGCDANYQLLSNNSCFCDTSLNTKFFINNTICYSCGNALTHCLTCTYTGAASAPFDSAAFLCVTCNNTAGYFIDPSNTCSLCSVSNCVTCSGLSTCSSCQPGFGVTASGQCSTCPVTGCQTCLNLTYCSICSTGNPATNGVCQTCSQSCTCGGYQLPRNANGDCSTTCGDGIIIFPNQACDDGNTLDGDGCSSSCAIEAYSTCGGTPSSCFLNQNINVALSSTVISKEQCNKITFQFIVVPNLLIFQQYPTNWTSFITTTNSALRLTSSSQSNGVVTQSYTYSETIQNKIIYFTVNPVGIVNSPYLSTVSVSALNVTVKPNNNIAAVYCDQRTCGLRTSSASFVTFQSVIAYIGLALSLFSLKIAGLEMFGVLQLSYFILSDYDFVNPLLLGVLDRKQVNGLNTQSNSPGSASISSRVTLNGHTSEIFVANFNIMLYLTFIIGLVGFCLYTATYFFIKSGQEVNQSKSLKQSQYESQSQRPNIPQQQSQPKSIFLHKVSKYLLKEVILTFILFNTFNLAFSAGLQMKYIDQVDAWAILCMLFSFTMLITMIVAQFVTDKLEFGQYHNQFKKGKLQSSYIVVTLMYRFTLGLLMALLNEWKNSGIVFLLVGSIFLTYIFAFEPFRDPIQNTRTKIVHMVHIVILLVYYLYRLDANYDQISSSYFLAPAYTHLIVVGFTIILSTFFLLYQFYKWVKQKCGSQKKQEFEQNQKQDVQANVVAGEGTLEVVREQEELEIEILDD